MSLAEVMQAFSCRAPTRKCEVHAARRTGSYGTREEMSRAAVSKRSAVFESDSSVPPRNINFGLSNTTTRVSYIYRHSSAVGSVNVFDEGTFLLVAFRVI